MKLTFVAIGVIIAALTPALADEPFTCSTSFAECLSTCGGDAEEPPVVGEHQTALNQQASAASDRQRARTGPSGQLQLPHRGHNERGEDGLVERVEHHRVGCCGKLAAPSRQGPRSAGTALRAARQTLRL